MMNDKKFNQEAEAARPLARVMARELSHEEIERVSGADDGGHWTEPGPCWMGGDEGDAMK